MKKKKKVEFQIWDLLCMVPPGSTTMAYPGRYHLARYRTPLDRWMQVSDADWSAAVSVSVCSW